MSFDKSGYRIFSRGQLGAAHEAAHRALDADDPRRGYDRLARFLDGYEGAGSEFLHLQWHLLVFELSLGLERDAWRRFDRVLRPQAAFTDLVATDAPAALWRMRLCGMPIGTEDFEEVRLGALRRSRHDRSHFVVLHDLLSLAGAGDVPTLREEFERHRAGSPVRAFTWGCLAVASGDYSVSARCFAEFLPSLDEVGGSHAQNELFGNLERWCRKMAQATRQTRAPRFATARAA